jgi:histidinol phosphatase-like enzyme
MDLNSAWSLALTFITGALGFLLKDKFAELKRLDILLNKTREEIARDYTTQAEVQRITDHIDRQFNKLEAKIDQLIQTRQ